jgi:glycosyltransferase involved in cell wall biosynthesis
LIHICHIISGDLWAGAEVVAFNLLEGLKHYPDLNISVITLNEDRLFHEIRNLGLRVHVLNENEMSFFNILLSTRRILKERPPAIIHSHRYKENIIAFLVSKTLPATKLISTQHGMSEVHERKQSGLRMLKSRCNLMILSKYFHGVVSVSQDIRQHLIKNLGFSKDRVNVIHNGIRISDALNTSGRSNYFTIGSSGRLFPVKDYPLMLEIARKVIKKSGKIRFVLAGDGPERYRLQTLIKEHNLSETFALPGHLDDMPPFYRKLDLYLNTSVHEGMPMSVLEAMSYELPVIAPEVGGLGEIVDDGKNGYLLRERDPGIFAEKCLALYENKGLRKRMAKAARRKVVREYSSEKMAENYYNLYREAVNTG